ncbi:MAG: helix-turn-helix domain-containing protein [Candidatus Accumulibacter sp.]|uniref:helix-turn-helix domain-containing protein n=1 Tax=Accumulibacter sp. TaxID=2053492 RepID=UPI00338FA50C|nr:helix-turn-helix domain-containing protein [Accumulibacter sp.]
MQNMKAYFRLSEVAKMLGVSYVTMWRWCNDGKVATVSLPSGQRRILGAEVNRLLEQPEPQEA